MFGNVAILPLMSMLLEHQPARAEIVGVCWDSRNKHPKLRNRGHCVLTAKHRHKPATLTPCRTFGTFKSALLPDARPPCADPWAGVGMCGHRFNPSKCCEEILTDLYCPPSITSPEVTIDQSPQTCKEGGQVLPRRVLSRWFRFLSRLDHGLPLTPDVRMSGRSHEHFSCTRPQLGPRSVVGSYASGALQHHSNLRNADATRTIRRPPRQMMAYNDYGQIQPVERLFTMRPKSLKTKTTN